MTLPKENAEDQPSAGPEGSAGASSSKSGSKGKKKKVVEELDEDDTTRGSRRIVPTPHRLLKKPSAKVHQHQKQAGMKLLFFHWGSVTKKLRVQPAGPSRFDWWEQTMGIIKNPHVSPEAEREEAELLRLEISEQMPTKLGDFNNHPLYALERHLKKFEVLYPKGPVLGHIRSEAIYPRSSVKQIKSKETWLKQARQIKSDETIPVKWVKSRPATLFQLRLRQQGTLSGSTDRDKSCLDSEVNDGEKKGVTNSESTEDQIPLFGEWQTEPYQPPWVVDGRVPRNQYGRLDVFTPAMVPVGGTHLKGRGIGRVARLLGVDFVEAVTGFEFQSRKSVPVVQGIVVPTECADLVMDAYHEMAYHADVEAQKKRRIELLRLWRKFIKGTMVRSRLLEEYGQNEPDDDKWEPVIEDEEEEKEGRVDGVQHHRNQDPSQGPSSSVAMESSAGSEQDTKASANFDRGGGFMLD
ncbi:hypothetical protein BGW38_001580 [Lunasporangiospora selenospora]|uniref:Uncharacterized protein n=1 Tax=Lunasporangiospora selenospora TaxID=979761 RepID=A0A9P6FUG1_9FUNG|nr:hypothetical protein BGW38_001580 [Lunasporangiospora selenospora]